jgi:RNA polymerase sigma factor (sigma-70 family)
LFVVANVLQHLRRWLAAHGWQPLPDGILLYRFVSDHDEAAFAALLERHGPMVLGVCRRVLRDFHDAEDACQATFLVLARKAASIRQPGAVGSWLHGVAYRVAGKLKARGAHRGIPGGTLDDVPQAAPPDVSWREVRGVLDEELRRLPECYRAPLVLCYLEGKTRDEAARQLGWSVGTLRGRLERGRERLRLRLTRRGLTLPAALAASVLVESAASAALPAELAETTIKAAIVFAAGKGLAAVSAPVAALVKGALRAMFLSKVKVVVAVVLALGLLGTGAGLLGRQAPAAQPPAPQQAGEEKAPARGPDRLRPLLEARVKAAEEELAVRMKEFEAGRGTLDICLGASRRLVEAQRDLGLKKQDWIAALEAHVKITKEIYDANEARFKAGRLSPADVKESEYYYLEAQIWLERARAQ